MKTFALEVARGNVAAERSDVASYVQALDCKP